MGDTMDLDGALFEAWEDVESCYSYNPWDPCMVYVPTLELIFYGKCR